MEHPINMNEFPEHEPFKVFYGDGKLIYSGNDILKMHWIRMQIKKNQIVGCYIEFKDEKISIDHFGNLSHYPDGFDEIITDIFMELV